MDGSQYASVIQHPEYARICIDKYAFTEYAFTGSKYVRILSMAGF